MITTVSNFKGGVGKTTSVLLFADILSKTRKVLLVDVDPQSNLTKYFGIKLDEIKKKNIMKAITDGSVKKNIVSVADNIDIVPSTIQLSDFEFKYAAEIGRELLLKNVLSDTKYDEVLIDTQPAATLITRNALFSAEQVVIPVEPDEWDIQGAESLVRNINGFRESALKNEIGIRSMFVLPTQYSFFSSPDRAYISEVRVSGCTTLPRIGDHGDALKKARLKREWKPSASYYKEYVKVAQEIWQNQ